MSLPNAVLLVGCGKMGGAMARGWLRGGLTRLVIVEPYADGLEDLAADARVSIVPALEDLSGELPGAVVLAVKPQMMDAALAQIGPRLGAGALVVSIAAGKVLAYFRQALPGARLVRAMPNLPASIGRGMSVLVADQGVGAAEQQQAEALLRACGDVGWVQDEALLDPVTALSGGGPAYVFHLVEAMAAAGVAAGLTPELSMRLARNTVAGAGALLAESDVPAGTLRENVCSPGGTTIEAINVLRGEDGLTPLMGRAVLAATRRATELGKL